MIILFGILVGALLWLVLKIFRHAAVAAAPRFSALKRAAQLVPAITFLAWLVYGFWIVHSLFSHQSFYPLLLLSFAILLVGLFGWFVLRDVMAGVVFSSRRQFRLHYRIRVGDLSGKIVGSGLTHLVVQTDQGDVARIPFSRLSGEVLSERAEERASDHHRVHVSVNKPASPDAIQAELLRRVLCNPWASFRVKPVVHSAGEDEASYSFEVRFQSLSPRHAARVERDLREQSWSASTGKV